MKKTASNAYLHTDEAHQDWYNRPIMGNLGDKRGIRQKDTKKQSSKKIHEEVQKTLKP